MLSRWQQKNPMYLKLAIDGLSDAVIGLERSDPQFVEIVNYIASA